MVNPARAQPISGTFVATGQSAAFFPLVNPLGVATFSVKLSSGVATVKLERSSDSGSTWDDVSADTLGTVASWVLNSTEVVVLVDEPEINTQYRLNCTAYTSGTVTYRLGQT